MITSCCYNIPYGFFLSRPNYTNGTKNQICYEKNEEKKRQILVTGHSFIHLFQINFSLVPSKSLAPPCWCSSYSFSCYFLIHLLWKKRCVSLITHIHTIHYEINHTLRLRIPKSQPVAGKLIENSTSNNREKVLTNWSNWNLMVVSCSIVYKPKPFSINDFVFLNFSFRFLIV